MDKILRPERLECDPSSPHASQDWSHWLRTFQNFLATLGVEPSEKLNILINFVAPTIYEFIKEEQDFDGALKTLTNLYVKPKNSIFARHLLASEKQKSEENLDQFLQRLKLLSTDCDFKDVTADICRSEAIRDAFITGMNSAFIRQRLLENVSLDLQSAFDQARTLELAQKNSALYANHDRLYQNAATQPADSDHDSQVSVNALYKKRNQVHARTSNPSEQCFFCGLTRHRRAECPAKDAVCHNCTKKGHFAKMCRSQKMSTSSALSSTSHLGVLSASVSSVSKALIPITVNGQAICALFDTGSSESFLNKNILKRLKVETEQSNGIVSMASTCLTTPIVGCCRVMLQYRGNKYPDFRMSVLPQLCSDAILGQDFMRLHQSVAVEFGGKRPPLLVCALKALKLESPSLFQNLTPDVRPVATKSRRYSAEDTAFIHSEIQRLLCDEIIEETNSPWRAQVLVTRNENHKKRLVIDYSQTINRFTLLDAYPLPTISDLVNKVAKHTVFSKLDLKSAYHQIKLKENEKQFTGFEADGRLFQFVRMPFGVTNGVAAFQRVMDRFIKDNKLVDTYAYLDDVTVCGKTKQEHDQNLERFMNAAEKSDLTLNLEKCKVGVTELDILGYIISNGEVKPDPSRTKALKEFPIPNDKKSLQRCVGMFAHYSRWIPNYSKKIQPLIQVRVFPLTHDAIEAFQSLKLDVEKSVLLAIDEQSPFTVETDASDFAIAATLSQNARPVAFYSRMLNNSEKRYPAIEKEACAVVEALRKWRHFLIGRHFTLVTDQKSISYMFNAKHASKIKNDKIQRWRIELSCYNFDVFYRAGSDNTVADTFSRPLCSAATRDDLQSLHSIMCHPGITRMLHFVKVKNLPYSIEEIREITRRCRICSECKPQFARPDPAKLIKSTRPFERLNIDFKGPLPSVTRNKYILTIVDEYSRCPFVYPCANTSTQTVINCLTQLFSIFGMPAYIHSDRGSAFISEEMQSFLRQNGVSSSKSTPYNPRGNGQCERYNGVIWKTITLALKSINKGTAHWESVIPVAMHSIRSLLCTATNATPHERFFSYERLPVNGHSMPTWLSSPGPVLLKKHVRSSKYDALVEEAELISVNPNYALVRKQNGQETTVSLRDVAPLGTWVSDPNKDDREYPLIDKLSNARVTKSIVTEGEKTSIVNWAGNNVSEKDSESKLTTNIIEEIKDGERDEIHRIGEHSAAHNEHNNPRLKEINDMQVIEKPSETQNEQSVPRRSKRNRKAPDRYQPS